MSAIEFSAQAGKTFSVQLYNATTGAPIGSSITGVTDASVPTRYRASTGTNTGVVYAVATTTNLRVAGYADLDAPAISGYSELRDSIESNKASFDVLPGRDRGAPLSARGRIVVAQGELVTIARQVVDGNGSPLNLSGRTLQFLVTDARGNVAATIASNDITVSGTGNSTYSFTVPSVASDDVGNFEYFLNDLGSSKAELAKGDWIVSPRTIVNT